MPQAVPPRDSHASVPKSPLGYFVTLSLACSRSSWRSTRRASTGSKRDAGRVVGCAVSYAEGDNITDLEISVAGPWPGATANGRLRHNRIMEALSTTRPKVLEAACSPLSSPLVLSIILLQGNISALTNFARVSAYTELIREIPVSGFRQHVQNSRIGALRNIENLVALYTTTLTWKRNVDLLGRLMDTAVHALHRNWTIPGVLEMSRELTF